MERCPATRSRPGFTLAELLVVLVLGALVLGVITTVGVRLERQLDTQSSRFASDEQLAAAVEVLPIDLRGLSPSAGDIAAGGARDTSLEIRASIASAIVCASAPGLLTLAWYFGASGQSIPSRASAGDTAWLLDDGVAGEQWRPVALGVVRRTPGVCAAVDASADAVVDRSHLWSAEISASSSAQPGSVVRVTRPERFSFYRASDGLWYLGLRSWSSASLAYTSVQPISGPYRSPLAASGVRFRYLDVAGAALPSGTSESYRVARIEALLAVDGSGPRAPTIDSLTVVAALRNRNE